MKVLVTGATGFIGQRLVERLCQAGDEVWVLSRRPLLASRALGVPAVSTPLELKGAPMLDAVVNLAGQPLPGGRWTERYKQRLRDSRIAFTENLLEDLALAGQAPSTWINGSAIGYYGACGDEPLLEHAAVGSDFPARLCQDWERVAQGAAERFDARVCLLRTGLVLGPGGALKSMLPAFRLGLGGPMGDGRQIMSWIHREDLVAMILFLLARQDARGAFNGTAPSPVSNRDFVEVLGRVLRRPACLPVPAGLLRLVLGEMAELLLTGQRVLPAAAQSLGFTFRFDDVEHALRQVLGRDRCD